MMFNNRFKNQNIIVTGGAEGLGKAITERYLQEGANVVIFDSNAPVLEKTVNEFQNNGLKNISMQVVDISCKKNLEYAFKEFDREYDSLEVIVNSAGIVGPSNLTITGIAVDDFDRVYAVNLRGSFLVAQQALKRMQKKNYGRILIIASIAGKEGNAGMVCYSTMKSGVIGLVKTLGKEFAETNITVNGIAPAVIRTNLVDNMPEKQVVYMTDKIPMKRCGTLEEFSSLGCWITSPEASFNTGFIFDLSGGRATY